jgi:hypothetical protein
VAASDQLLADRPVIVDLPVENNGDRTIFIADRLMAGCKVDDAEAAHAEADPALGEEPIIVRAAMRHHVAHTTQYGGIDARVVTEF